MLVYFEPGYACPLLSDLLLAPLPSRKALWEAGDEVVWRKEFERQSNPAFALAATGDLVVVDEGTRYCSDAVLSSESGKQTRRVGKWEEWCAGMDGFGALVLLAASLVA